MKRKLLALMCITVISAGMLAGCESSDSSSTTDTTTEATQEEAEGQTAASEKDVESAVSEEEAAEAGFSDGSEAEAAGTDDAEAEDAEAEDAKTDDSKAEDASAEESDQTKAAEADETGSEAVVLNTDEQLTGIHHAEIEVKDYGTIELELDADTAPISVTNFVKLVQDHFYDGLTFHRIMDGFMIQGGDPSGDGTGGSSETIKGEFSNNGVTNDISHIRGTLSMARASDPDSASSQFFIVQTDSTFLDGDYAGFGKVTEGMDIVDQICKDVTPTDDNGTVKKEEQPVITSITIID